MRKCTSEINNKCSEYVEKDKDNADVFGKSDMLLCLYRKMKSDGVRAVENSVCLICNNDVPEW